MERLFFFGSEGFAGEGMPNAEEIIGHLQRNAKVIRHFFRVSLSTIIAKFPRTLIGSQDATGKPLKFSAYSKTRKFPG
jgi:hypothetical protein